MKPAEFIIELRDATGDRTYRRLAIVLKALLRQHGFKCVSIREVSNATEATTPSGRRYVREVRKGSCQPGSFPSQTAEG